MSSETRAWDKTGNRNRGAYLWGKVKLKCTDCNRKYPQAVLDFHHPIGVIKTMALEYKAWRGIAGPKPEVVAEANQCLVLCANCHRLEHIRMKNEKSDIGHRDGRPETEEGLGSGDQGCGYQKSFDFEEPDT